MDWHFAPELTTLCPRKTPTSPQELSPPVGVGLSQVGPPMPGSDSLPRGQEVEAQDGSG